MKRGESGDHRGYIHRDRAFLPSVLYAERLDERRERGWLVAPTRVVEKEAGERRAPILEHAHECAVREMRGRVLLRHERETNAVERRTNQESEVIRCFL